MISRYVCFLTILTVVFAAACQATEVTYKTPPKCLIWMEGEDCKDHNWVEGPSYRCWTYPACGIHGGVLDLASWKLPDCGEYYAKFPFKLKDSGGYVIYFLGRYGLASPFEWSVDNGKPVEASLGTSDLPGRLALTDREKYAVLRLGEFNASPGSHVLKISVKKPVFDAIYNMYSQQIDAIGIAPASWKVEGAEPPKPRIAGSDEGAPSGACVNKPTEDNSKRRSLALRSGNMLFEVSPVNGGLRRASLLGRPVVAFCGGPAEAPITVDFRDGTAADCGRVVRATSGKGEITLWCRSERFTSKIIYKALPGGEVSLVCDINNLTRVPIWRVNWHLSRSIGIGGSSADDTWHVAQSTIESKDCVGLKTAISPMSFAFDWACLTDKSAAFYAMFEDRALLDTEVTYGRDHTGGMVGTLHFSKFPRVKPGESWQSPPLILGGCPGGDWHIAADRFSKWWYSWAKTPSTPEWAKSVGGVGYGMSYFEDNALAINEEHVNSAKNATGITCFHSADWIRNVTECWYPAQMYLDLDKIRRFREVTDSMRKAGGHSSIYSNALMFSRATPDYNVWVRDLGDVSNTGDIWFTEHDTHHHPDVLPYPNEVLAEKYCDIMERTVLAGQPDILYMDQLGAVPACIDFAPDKHKHEHYGEWTSGEVKFVKYVRDRFVSRNPNLALVIEGTNPAVLQYANFTIYELNPVIRYIFPTYYGLAGGYDFPTPDVALDRAREGLLLGEPLLLLDTVQENASRETVKRIRDIVTLKRSVDPLLYGARFRDDVGLSTSDGVKASVFAAANRTYVAFHAGSGAGEIHVRPAKLGVRVRGEARVIVAGGDGRFVPCKAIKLADGSIVLNTGTYEAGLFEIR